MNSRGSLTVDFLFAFFLVCGFSLVVITFSATLTMVEVVQYMSFSSARQYFAANVSEEKQKEAAAEKFFSLKSNPIIAPLLNGGWFNVPDESFLVASNIPEKYPAFQNYRPEDPKINLFHGVIVRFQAKILDFQIPLFGGSKKSDAEDDEGSSGFSTHITAFLGREPSFEECNLFNENRWENIQRLPNSVGASPYSTAGDKSSYVIINDNGG